MHAEGQSGCMHRLLRGIVHVNHPLEVIERTQQTMRKCTLEFLSITLCAADDAEISVFMPYSIPKLSRQLKATIMRSQCLQGHMGRFFATDPGTIL